MSEINESKLAAKLKSMEHPDWVQELRDKWRRHNGAVLPISWETLDGLVDYWTENVRPWVDHEVTPEGNVYLFWGIGKFRGERQPAEGQS